MIRKLRVTFLFAAAIAVSAFFSVNAYGSITPIVDFTAISTGGDEDAPLVLVDDDGNAHVLWASQGSYLYYMMVDFDGNVVVNETNLNPCAAPDDRHVRRPSAVLDSSGSVHIVFQGWSHYTDLGATEYGTMTALTASEVIYTNVDPGAYLAGGADDINDLIVVEETIISNDDGWKSRASNIAIAGDMLHVAWFDGDSINDISINYTSYDLNTTKDIPPTSLVTGLNVEIRWGETEIATDPDGNVHIAYCTDLGGGKDDREIYYLMVDGSTGDVLIDATMITADDDESSVRPRLAVDSTGMVHVVWHDRRLYVDPPKGKASEHEIYYLKLDPSLDDQSGDAADPAAIIVIGETLLSADNEKRSSLKNLFIDIHDWIHVVWSDGEWWEYNESYRNVVYTIFDTVGNAVAVKEAETVIFATDGNLHPIHWWRGGYRHPVLFVFNGRAFVTFNTYNIMEETSDIYLGIFDVPPPSCDDGIQNGDETGVDCGGSVCPPCPTGDTGDDDGCGCAVFEGHRDLGLGQLTAFAFLALIPFAYVVVLRRRLKR